MIDSLTALLVCVSQDVLTNHAYGVMKVNIAGASPSVLVRNPWGGDFGTADGSFWLPFEVFNGRPLQQL